MNIVLRKPRMHRAEFFDWTQSQDSRYEFDGFQPVAMTGSTVNHSQMRASSITDRQQCKLALPVGFHGDKLHVQFHR